MCCGSTIVSVPACMCASCMDRMLVASTNSNTSCLRIGAAHGTSCAAGCRPRSSASAAGRLRPDGRPSPSHGPVRETAPPSRRCPPRSRGRWTRPDRSADLFSPAHPGARQRLERIERGPGLRGRRILLAGQQFARGAIPHHGAMRQAMVTVAIGAGQFLRLAEPRHAFAQSRDRPPRPAHRACRGIRRRTRRSCRAGTSRRAASCCSRRCDARTTCHGNRRSPRRRSACCVTSSSSWKLSWQTKQAAVFRDGRRHGLVVLGCSLPSSSISGASASIVSGGSLSSLLLVSALLGRSHGRLPQRPSGGGGDSHRRRPPRPAPYTRSSCSADLHRWSSRMSRITRIPSL